MDELINTLIFDLRKEAYRKRRDPLKKKKPPKSLRLVKRPRYVQICRVRGGFIHTLRRLKAFGFEIKRSPVQYGTERSSEQNCMKEYSITLVEG